MDDSERIAEALQEHLGESVLSCERLGGGTNSEVRRVTTVSGRDLVIKVYPRDRRDRARNEHRALELLHGHGLPVPDPVFLDEARQIGAYRFTPGEPFRTEALTASDVDHAARFMVQMVEISRQAREVELPVASDARFSVEEHFQGIADRVRRLETVGSAAPISSEMLDFMRAELIPFVAGLKEWTPPGANGEGSGRAPASERILSASDFGFHNAIREPGGRVLFLDLEYFGWDDPAKTIADIFLQPDVPVPVALRAGFMRRVLPVLDVTPEFLDRFRRIYPLSGLKWLLVLLNVFLRPVAGPGAGQEAAEALRRRQLGRARTMLEALRADITADVVPPGALD